MVRPVILVVVSALATLFAVDLAVRRVSPLKPALIEVEDGVADYQASDPDILVLGSSHTRPFAAVAAQLPGQKTALVAIEFGTVKSFNWVRQHRLRRLIEERGSDGQLKRKRLSRALVIVTYWDLCGKKYTGLISNLPARAWTLRQFVEDFFEVGLTEYNRNYLTNWWKTHLPLVMVQARGEDRITEDFAHLGGDDEALQEKVRATSIARQKAVVERARTEPNLCNDAVEQAALDEIVGYFQNRGVDVTVVMFPLVPDTLTDEARAITLKEFSDWMFAHAREKSFRAVDMTTSSPMVASDFQDDMDHISPAGSLKFAAWALEHGLEFLKK